MGDGTKVSLHTASNIHFTTNIRPQTHLAHEAGDDPVEGAALVAKCGLAGLTQLLEVLRSLGHDVLLQMKQSAVEHWGAVSADACQCRLSRIAGAHAWWAIPMWSWRTCTCNLHPPPP
jgi:hypothetical protein